MATNAQTLKTPAAPKIKRAPVAVSQRLIDQMKRGALQGKLSTAELDNLASLANSLKIFVANA